MERIDESPLTAEEKANLDLLKITDKGLLTGVTDKEKLAGSLVLPDSITEIGEGAFADCSALQRVIISESVTKIADRTFSLCSSLTHAVIPENVTEIDREAFYGCISLTTVVIPNTVATIEWAAFSGCTSLKNITIFNSVITIGNGAFEDINPDAHFTVASESVKELLLNSSSNIRDEQITVDVNL